MRTIALGVTLGLAGFVPAWAQGAPQAQFDWVEYTGADPVFDAPLAPGEYRNPVLAGFHPDPSVVRVGEDFYLVNSTFAFYPGLPVFHSRDLVNWTQLANALDRPDMMPFDGLHLGQNGIYAPAISHHDGRFHIITTCVACGMNFVISAEDPSGPWSDPVWLPELHGIDPSLFFDADGRAYIVHHRDPEVKREPSHTAVYAMEVDPVSFQPVSEDVMLVDGGDPAPWHTEWLEGPHIYRVGDHYILTAAGGGTGYYHGQLAYRSDHPLGPYEANPDNPFLTQLGLPDDRPDPVTAAGHADLVETADGDWWVVFLGTRVFDLDQPPQDPGRFLTGRETFLLPVSWEEGWPVVLNDAPIPFVAEAPDLPASEAPTVPLTGNFTVREEFDDADELGLAWLFARIPDHRWWQTGDGALSLDPSATDRMGEGGEAAFVGRRLAHMQAALSTAVRFDPEGPGDEAGLMAVQNDAHFYAFGLSRNARGETVLRVRRRWGEDSPVAGEVLAEQAVTLDAGSQLDLRIRFDHGRIAFDYRSSDATFQTVLEGADSSPLMTAIAGGFTGAVIGVFAQTTAR